jgi:uncharacterized protein (TIGR02145 family)
LSNLTTGAWCYYDNDPTNGTLYGKLYNWYAVAGIYDAASLNNPTLRKQLVPIGWHVPSDIEWTNLIQYLDPSATATFNGFQSLIAGGKMKEMGTANWNSPNVGADNSTGFTGLPGGILDTYMETPADTVHGFYSVGSDGIWWSTTVQDTVHAWTCSLSYYYGGVATFYSNKAFGFSVRCLKD